MKVILARSAGFCWGVRRAMERVLQISESTQAPVFTLGPLIHNPQTVALLESKNVHAVERPDEAGGGTLVYRAHGIPPQLRAEAQTDVADKLQWERTAIACLFRCSADGVPGKQPVRQPGRRQEGTLMLWTWVPLC